MCIFLSSQNLLMFLTLLFSVLSRAIACVSHHSSSKFLNIIERKALITKFDVCLRFPKLLEFEKQRHVFFIIKLLLLLSICYAKNLAGRYGKVS